jgi:hypothetical protein
MSCGKLHEPGQVPHLHAPGEEHHEDVPAGDVPGGELAAPEAPKPPGWVQRAFTLTGMTAAGAWHHHGYMVKPFAAIPAMECSELVISHAFTAPLPALAAAGVITVLGEGVTEVVNWRGRAVRPVRAKTRAAVVAGGAMAAIGGAGVFDEWTALATLVIGALAAGRIVHEEHKAHGNRPRRPQAVETAGEPSAITAGPDPRLTQFTDAFCGPEGKLAGAIASFREVTNGILFELDLTGTDHGPDDVAALVKQVAKKFGVVRDAISVEYVPEPGKHNENYCQVVIRKIPVLSVTEHGRSAVRPWDGATSYDAGTGCCDLGWFADGLVTHFQFNEPGSGAKHTFLAGATGAGKTGTINVLGCEAGLAKLCRTCGYARSCPSCSLERVMAVWMGDALGNGLPAWQGRADLSATGPGGCLEMLEFASQVARDRVAYRRTMPWEDRDPHTGKVERYRGKSFHNPEIGDPLIFFVLDEFPELVGPDADPLMRDTALRIIIRALNTWRKLGIHLLLTSNSADTSLIGDRLIRDLIASLNIIGHRVDSFSASMLGLIGDSSKLPRDLPGAGFTLGPDSRPLSEFATKFAREHRRPGDLIDIRSIARDIGRTPLLYDPPVQRLMAEGQWGIEPRHQFTEWYGRPQAEGAMPVPFTGLAAVPSPAAQAPSPAVIPQSPAAPGTVSAEDLERILSFLAGNPGPHSLGSIVNGIFQADGTRMSVATVMAAAPALHAAGQAVYSNKQLQAA